MFTGKYEIKVDTKRRIYIPKAFSKEIKNIELLIISHDECLSLIPKNEVVEYLSQVESCMSSKDINSYERYIFQKMHGVTLDEQNRVSIPANMAKDIQLDRKVTLIGIRNRIEIWKPETLKLVQEQEKEVLAKIPQNVLSLKL